MQIYNNNNSIHNHNNNNIFSESKAKLFNSPPAVFHTVKN